MKPLGYTEMLIDGKQTEGDAPHHSTVEFNCGNERHKYYCYDGTFHPKHTFDPCGLGYAGMSVNGNTLNGHLVEGSVVALGCRDGCTAPGNTTADHDRYVFTTSPKDGLYESGTEVALFCKSGPVVGGPSESVCQGGDWNPPLGRCPEMCDKDDLTKMNFDNTKLSEPEETNLQYHGGKASATCTANSTTGKALP
ncbi:unnamed protein product [Heligmosomoides polygyrus]|uniref:Sushi domain-containing protein n=1 Tax=Heligmosomoides polygyrus TaxID=6339 RepID=A0A183FDR1_HELPZ|nr:unnamed protein product [Heligmosomoides polygyrus]